MPKAGNSREKSAARRVQAALNIPYTTALAMLREYVAAQSEHVSWTAAADAVIAREV